MIKELADLIRKHGASEFEQTMRDARAAERVQDRQKKVDEAERLRREAERAEADDAAVRRARAAYEEATSRMTAAAQAYQEAQALHRLAPRQARSRAEILLAELRDSAHPEVLVACYRAGQLLPGRTWQVFEDALTKADDVGAVRSALAAVEDPKARAMIALGLNFIEGSAL